MSIHSYTFDLLGRPTADAVTTLGTGVDGTVRRMETAYDGQGNPYLFTTYDAASSGNVVNQVQRAFNGLGQLTTEYQEHSGSVNTGTSLNVQYGYSFVSTSGGPNHSRLTSMTYPDLRVLNYNYSSGLDANVSRLSSISDTSATLEAYTYLGAGTVVKRAHAQPGVDLTYIKQTGESNGDAGDQYTGLDRFGRIVDQRWIKTSTGTATDRFQYGYDRDGNPLYRDNLVNTAFGELYHADGSSNGYDQLNQLSAFARGTLNASKDSISGTASRSQSWTPDAIGNFSSVTTDGTSQSRTHNQQNELTGVGSTTVTSDADGNMTTDETGRQFVYDAWNRLAQVKDSSGSTLETLRSDALGRRVSEAAVGTTRDLHYSSAWQVLEERVGGQAVVQNVWSPVYVDAIVERDRDVDGNAVNGREERLYVQQDANWNVTALINTSGTVVERLVYDPFGVQTVLDGSWVVRTGGSAFSWLYGHQGLRYDGLSALYHVRAREFSPSLSRWSAQDPLKYAAGDSNLYRFEGNGPQGRLDPSGQKPIAIGPVEATATETGIRITFTGAGAQNKGFFRVKQWMQVEVTGIYECPEPMGKCSYHDHLVPPRRDIEPPLQPGERPHDHSHVTAVPHQPELQLDHGDSKDQYSEGRYVEDERRKDRISYTDDPTLGHFAHKQAALLPDLPATKKFSDGRICRLVGIRVVQRFVTIVFLGGRAIATFHWTSTTEGAPGKPGLPTTRVEGGFQGEKDPATVVKESTWAPED